MYEWFAFHVEDHLKALDRILADLKRIDTYPLDMVDMSRIGDAKRDIASEIASFRRMAEAARVHEEAVA